MKKIFGLIIAMLFVFALVSCKNTTTLSETTLAPSSTTQMVETTTEATTTVAPTTTQPPMTTTEVISTTAGASTYSTTTTTTTVIDPLVLYFDGMTGDGTLANPYLVEVTEGDSFFKTLKKTYDNATPVYEEGIIESGAFRSLTERDTVGLDLNKATNSSFKFTALTYGTFFVKISDDSVESIYVQVNANEYVVDYSQSLKVLSIGNSFSIDANEYLYKVADNYGVSEIVLGVLYIGGSSLNTHAVNIADNSASYEYKKNTNDNWSYAGTTTLLDGLVDEDWDIIIIQQVSGSSGLPSTYNEDLETVIDFVQQHKTNSFAKLVWHMTWAYQQDTTHYAFASYNSDQLTMYQAITLTVQSKIVSRDEFAYVIPVGTAIQNLRTSYMGDTLTRDGYHLSNDVGRYTAALTFFKQITGLSINAITYKPAGVSNTDLSAMVEAVNNAVSDPFNITDSTFEIE